MKIEANHKLSDIQKVFNDKYPYLKLEFFSKPHAIGSGSPKKEILNNALTVMECCTKESSGEISFDSQVKASEIEQIFMDIFGISAQIFRHSGKVWLETTTTDEWTLEAQNLKGQETTV